MWLQPSDACFRRAGAYFFSTTFQVNIMFQPTFANMSGAFAISLAMLAPVTAAADCIRATGAGDGFAGPGTYTTAEGYQLVIEPADYTPHGDNALGFVAADMGAVECLGASEGYGLKSAALRLTISGEQPVNTLSIAYCTSYPILNISAGSESPPAYHENWKRDPIPAEIADDAGDAVQVVNAPVWNGDTYMDEAQITLTSEAGLNRVLFGLREGFVTEICLN